MIKKIKQPLGDQLVAQGVISQQQLDAARREERSSGESLRRAPIKQGAVAEEDLAAFVAQQLDIPQIELKNYLVDPQMIELLPEDLARKHQMIPILKIGKTLTCAMVDPMNVFALDEVRAKTGFTIEPAIATETEIKKALEEHYSVTGSFEDVIASLDEEKLGFKEGEEVELRRLRGVAEEPPVIKLVNMLIMEAVHDGASDIHIEPEQDHLRIRFRVDGILHEQKAPPKHFQSAIVSRIKILANLNIAERRKPQDGRFQMKMENSEIDVRVSCVPTIHGENVVMRLLDTVNVLLGLEDLGFSKETLATFKKLLARPNGIILVTGPTGSGKTTTLYAALNTLNTRERNIITVEDPVEYRLEGVRQIQVNPQVELTFAAGLRSILRQDPDIIMVGEIRDLETAEVAIQAALTGHLVFATLHTNDAPGAMTRLMDMGVEPFLISSSVVGVIAQRLVRKVCKDCKDKETPKGCKTCLETGYKGRTGIYEIMVSDEAIRQLTTQKSSLDKIRKVALAAGMKTLREDGMEKVKAGVTTEAEVIRVTQEE